MTTNCDIYYQSFKTYLGPPIIEAFRESNAFRKDTLGKLQKLPYEQFMDLTTDVYDELIRRSEESKRLPFLPPSTSYSAKRNQARQKLGTLSDNRFKVLIGDLFVDLLIRFPDLDKSFKDCIRPLTGSSERPPLPKTPPSSMAAQMFDISNIMNDILDRKSLNSYSEAPNSHATFPTGFEGVSKKYEAELAVAFRINQELEKKLMHKSLSFKNPELEAVGETRPSEMELNLELLKEDYKRLQKEYERTKASLNRTQVTLQTLASENKQLKQSLSLYEVEGATSLAAQFASLQRQHAEMKYEYQVEMEGLRRRYIDLEAAQAKQHSVIESFEKSNEVLETKLRQVNRALESSQQDTTAYLNNNPTLALLPDNSPAFLISDAMMQQLRSSAHQLLEASRNGSCNDVVLAAKPVTARGRMLLETVEHFEREVQGSKPNYGFKIAHEKDDFASALSNLLTLTKQQSASSPQRSSSRFEREVSCLLSSAESLQLLLQTNFCSLPFFSQDLPISDFKASRPTRSMGGTRSATPFNVPVRSYSNPESMFGQSSRCAHLSKPSHVNQDCTPQPCSSTSDDLMLEPLREYLEEQTEVIIHIIDHMMGFIRSDAFSSELADEVGTVHRKVQQMLVETKQYAAVPHLQESPRLEGVLSGLSLANQRFIGLLEGLLPIVEAGSPPSRGFEGPPNLHAFKQRFATLAFALARQIKALVQSVS